MPLTFYRCKKCKREHNDFKDANDCEMTHLEAVSVKNVKYTIRNWPYSVEVTFSDGSKRIYNAEDMGG